MYVASAPSQLSSAASSNDRLELIDALQRLAFAPSQLLEEHALIIHERLAHGSDQQHAPGQPRWAAQHVPEQSGSLSASRSVVVGLMLLASPHRDSGITSRSLSGNRPIVPSGYRL